MPAPGPVGSGPRCSVLPDMYWELHCRSTLPISAESKMCLPRMPSAVHYVELTTEALAFHMLLGRSR